MKAELYGGQYDGHGGGKEAGGDFIVPDLGPSVIRFPGLTGARYNRYGSTRDGKARYVLEGIIPPESRVTK